MIDVLYILFVIFFCYKLFEYQLKIFFLLNQFYLYPMEDYSVQCNSDMRDCPPPSPMFQLKVCSKETLGEKMLLPLVFLLLLVMFLVYLDFLLIYAPFQHCFRLKHVRVNGHERKKGFKGIDTQIYHSNSTSMDMYSRSCILHFSKIQFRLFHTEVLLLGIHKVLCWEEGRVLPKAYTVLVTQFFCQERGVQNLLHLHIINCVNNIRSSDITNY